MAYARLFSEKFVEQRADFIDVEELCSSIALERAPDVGVNRRVPKPLAYRNGKTELLSVCDLLGQHARCGAAKSNLVSVFSGW